MPSATAAPPRVDYSRAEGEILSRLDLRAVFASLGVQFTQQTPNPAGWLECRAIGREDAKPSAGCHLTSGRYKDFARPDDNLSLWELAARYGGSAYGGDWRTARAELARQAGVEIPEEPESAAFKALEILPESPNDDLLLETWCRTKRGTTPAAVRAAGGRIGRYRRRYTVVVVPVVGPSLDREQSTGWVAWEITGKDLPTFTRGNKEPTGWTKMKTLAGSKRGLIVLGNPSAPIAWKVEGPTDAMALWAAIPEAERPSHVVITNTDGASAHPDAWRVGAFSASRRVHVIGDADTPGQRGAEKWAAAIAASGKDVRNVALPYDVAVDHGKDMRDFLSAHTFAELATIAEATKPAASTAAPSLEAADDPHRLARLFLDERYRHQGDAGPTTTLRHWQDQWYAWNGQCYRPLSENYLRARFTECIKREFDRLSTEAESRPVAEGKDGPPPTIKVTRNTVGNAMQALHSLCALPDECVAPAIITDTGWVSASKETLICANGYLDLGQARDTDTDLRLYPLSPRLWMHNSVPYSYDPTAPIPTRWLDFLCNQWHNENTRDHEAVNLLQEWFGYCLTTDNCHEKIMMIVGSPRSGKGTIADTLSALIGEENRCSTSLSALATRFGLEPLIGKSLAVIGDARLSGRSDIAALVERLLSVSGSDPQSIDRKRIQAVEVKLAARFMLLTNELPDLRDASGAMASRFLVLETSNSFLGREDKRLKTALKAPDTLPGILNWAIDGYRNLSRRGHFVVPESSRDAIEELEELTSPIHAFLTDSCDIEKTLSVEADELFRAYVEWCRREERPPQPRAKFGRDLRSRGIKKSRLRAGAHRAYFYHGVALKGEKRF